MRSSILTFVTLALLATTFTHAQSSTGVVTQLEECLAPISYPPYGTLPRICADIGFTSCATYALNITLTVDGAPVYSEIVPEPLLWSFTYPIDELPGCNAVASLSSDSIVTPEYVHAQPQIKIVCGGRTLSTQKIEWITLGAQCSTHKSCDACTATPVCGWCSSMPDFLQYHDITDNTTYNTYSTSGRCLNRGVDDSVPWCDTCTRGVAGANIYTVEKSVCPNYVGAQGGSSAAGGGDSGGTGTAGTIIPPSSGDDSGNGNKTMKILLIVFLILLIVSGVIIAYLCVRHRRSKQPHANVRYTKTVEMRGLESAAQHVDRQEDEEFRVGSAAHSRQLVAPLTAGGDSEYVPPSLHDEEASVSPSAPPEGL